MEARTAIRDESIIGLDGWRASTGILYSSSASNAGAVRAGDLRAPEFKNFGAAFEYLVRGRTMRLLMLTLAAIGSVSGAAAQTLSTDGTARLATPPGAYFTREGVRAPFAKQQMRQAIVTLMANGKIDTSEQDFLREVIAQKPFALSIDGAPQTLNVPAAEPEAAALAALLLTPPNMHTLWHAEPDKTEQLVEISRWGPAAHSRVTAFFGSKLYEAWGQSNILNAFSPFVSALGLEWNAVKVLGDPESVVAGKQLLIEGCEYAKQKVAAEGKAPPEDFLCAWMQGSL